MADNADPFATGLFERAKLASPAEPAAHSLQTLAPASDAVKPGDESAKPHDETRGRE